MDAERGESILLDVDNLGAGIGPRRANAQTPVTREALEIRDAAPTTQSGSPHAAGSLTLTFRWDRYDVVVAVVVVVVVFAGCATTRLAVSGGSAVPATSALHTRA